MSVNTAEAAVASTTTSAIPPTGGLHHVAYACRDVDETHHFYQDLMGLELVYTEIAEAPRGGWFRHLFYDLGDGSCLAFFDIHGVGEKEGWSSAISRGNGLPVWVNHVAFKATTEQQEAVRARMTAAGVEPLMEVDHEWCHSLYYLDPNGIMVEMCRDTTGFRPDHDAAVARLHSTEHFHGRKTIVS